MLILIGSTRPAKVEGVREAVAVIARADRRFASAQLQTHDLTTVAPRMPMSVAEIIDGARRRAEALIAFGAQSGADASFAVGVEGGLERMPCEDERWVLQTWAAVTDGTRWGYGGGPSLMLPVAVAASVVGGEELGDVIDELAGKPVRGTRGAWGLLTRDLIGRRDAFRLATIAAFVPFYNGVAYGIGTVPR